MGIPYVVLALIVNVDIIGALTPAVSREGGEAQTSRDCSPEMDDKPAGPVFRLSIDKVHLQCPLKFYGHQFPITYS